MKATVIEIDAAHPFLDDEIIPNVFIKIRRRAKPKTLAQAKARDRRQAKQICDALGRTLPVAMLNELHDLMTKARDEHERRLKGQPKRA